MPSTARWSTGPWDTDMGTFGAELLRCIRSKWFMSTVILTMLMLWTELGAHAAWLVEGAYMESYMLMEEAFTGKGNPLSLPLLAALPYSAAPYREIRSGAVRASLFRSGVPAYLHSRVWVCVISAVISQLLGILGFWLVVCSLSRFGMLPFWKLAARLLAAGIFALLGSVGALLTKDGISAYAMPVTLAFALSMIRSRFLINATYLDPLYWLEGDVIMCGYLCGALLICACGYALILYREVRRSV